MKIKSAGNAGPIRASDLPKPTRADMARLQRAMKGPIDISDIPEQRSLKRHGPIWHAIANEMRRQGISAHQLWKRARVFCPKIPESAVYEFLTDKRSVRVVYADAMLQALNLRLIPAAARQRRAG